MKCLLLCLVGIAAVSAQLPRPCESPRQWEGRVLTVDRSKRFFEYGKISYDELSRRVRIIEERDVDSDRDYYDKLFLHNVGKEYSLNLKTRKCNVTNLTRPFRPFGVPPEAVFEGAANVGLTGAPGEYMVVENFAGNFTDGTQFFGAVTTPSCIPLASAILSKDIGFAQRSFFDVNIGIADPNVFIPPRECA